MASSSARIFVDGSPNGRFGESRIGGSPDVPAEFLWPEWNGLPMTFIGQVRLDRHPTICSEHGFRPVGMLAFFYDADAATMGDDPSDRGSGRVFWFSDAASLRTAAVPSRLPRESVLVDRAVTLVTSLTLPPLDWDRVQVLDLSTQERHAYGRLRRRLLETLPHRSYVLPDAPPDDVVHRFLGYPDEIQDGMEDELRLASKLIGPREAFEWSPGGERAHGWQLLLQVDSDPRLGSEWGDAGRLYFYGFADDDPPSSELPVWVVQQFA